MFSLVDLDSRFVRAGEIAAIHDPARAGGEAGDRQVGV